MSSTVILSLNAIQEVNKEMFCLIQDVIKKY